MNDKITLEAMLQKYDFYIQKEVNKVSRCLEEREDIMQSIRLKICRAYHGFNGDHPFAWVGCVTKTTILDHYKKQNKHNKTYTFTEVDAWMSHNNEEDTIPYYELFCLQEDTLLEPVVLSEFQMYLYGQLKTDEERAVFLAKLREDDSGEIAEDYNIPVEQVYRIVRRIKERFSRLPLAVR